MNKLYLTAVIAMLSFASAGAQKMMAYDMKVTNGTYQEVTDGTVIPVTETGKEYNNLVIDGTGTANYDEFTGKGHPIGFDFSYNGKKVNQFMVGTNGYLLFGKDQVYASCTTNPFLVFNNSKDHDLIGCVPIGGVTNISTTQLSYKVEGESPNRTLVVQYKDLIINNRFATEKADTVQMQYRLYEATGNLSLTCNGFKPWSGASLNYCSFKIGILGDIDDRLMLSDFSSGATTTNDKLISWSQSSYPADGVTYTFIAPEPCVTPASQPTALTLNAKTTSISGSFTPTADADHYLVLASKDATLTELPVNGTTYAAGETLGNATVIAATEDPSFSSSSTFTASTAYNVFVLGYNSKCNGGPLYNTVSPLTNTVSTMASAPDSISISDIDANEMTVSVDAPDGVDVFVAYTDEVKTTKSGNIYKNEGIFGTPTGTYNVGNAIDGGGKVAYIGKAGSFKVSSLQAGQLYFFRAWSTDDKGNYSSDAIEQGAITAAYLPWDAHIDNMASNDEPVGWKREGSFKKQRSGYLMNEITTADTEKGTLQWLETPDIYLSEGQNRVFADIAMEQIGTWYNDAYTFGDGDTLKLQITTDGKAYKDLAVYTKDNDPNFAGVDKFNSFAWTFADYAGKKVRLRFYIKSTQATAFYLNSMSAMQKPECDYPIDLAVTSKDGKKATITWASQGDENAWEVSYKKNSDEEWSEPVTVSERQYVLDNLDSYTSYNVRVRALCSTTSHSDWSDSLTFKSALYIPFLITMADETDEPEGWGSYTGVLADPTVLESGNDFYFDSYGSGNLSFSSYDETCNSWYTSPQLDLETGKEYELSLDITTGYRSSYSTPSTDNKIMLMVASDGENFYSKDVLRTISYDEYKDERTNYTFSIPVKGYSGKVRLGIYVTSTTGAAISFYINSIGLKQTNVSGIGRSAVTDDVAGSQPTQIYNAAGQRTDHLQKGINIIRHANGKTTKLLVK